MTKKLKKKTVTAESVSRDRERVPSKVIESFGQIGFVKWTCAYCPVLIIDPMELVQQQKTLPEGIYHAWMYHIDKANMNPEDDELPFLVYWYGTTYEFSIVAKSKIVPLETAQRLGYDRLPDFIRKRLDLGRTAPTAYHLCEDAFEELEKVALKMKPEERAKKIVNPKRKKEVVLNEWHALAVDPPPEKQIWMRKRDRLLRTLPNREYFGKIGFLPFTKGGGKAKEQHYHPVLVLSPFRVPAGPIRSEWFAKCTSNKQMILVYWMGAYVCGREQTTGAYSFNYLSQLLSWEEGKAKGYDKLQPHVMQEYYGSAAIGANGKARLKKKREVGHRLSWTVDWLVCGHWELKQALERSPEDRWGGLEDFEEGYDDDFDAYTAEVKRGKKLIAKANRQQEKLKMAIADVPISNNNNTKTTKDTEEAKEKKKRMMQAAAEKTRNGGKAVHSEAKTVVNEAVQKEEKRQSTISNEDTSPPPQTNSRRVSLRTKYKPMPIGVVSSETVNYEQSAQKTKKVKKSLKKAPVKKIKPVKKKKKLVKKTAATMKIQSEEKVPTESTKRNGKKSVNKIFQTENDALEPQNVPNEEKSSMEINRPIFQLSTEPKFQKVEMPIANMPLKKRHSKGKSRVSSPPPPPLDLSKPSVQAVEGPVERSDRYLDQQTLTDNCLDEQVRRNLLDCETELRESTSSGKSLEEPKKIMKRKADVDEELQPRKKPAQTIDKMEEVRQRKEEMQLIVMQVIEGYARRKAAQQLSSS